MSVFLCLSLFHWGNNVKKNVGKSERFEKKKKKRKKKEKNKKKKKKKRQVNHIGGCRVPIECKVEWNLQHTKASEKVFHVKDQS